MKHSISLALLAVLTLALTGCRKGADTAETTADDASADSAAVAFYQMRADGRYEEYIDAMESCDKMPADYKKRTLTMLRHHDRYIKEEKGGVKGVTALRSETHDKGRMANVFLKVSYGDGSHEEVLFPVVYDGKRWRVQ